MKRKRLSLSILICLMFVASNTLADNNESAVHGLAQGCYAIQSPTNGNFLKKFHKGGPVDNGLSYRFENIDIADATHFFMKPTSYSYYMLTDKDGRYLASHLPAEISAGRYAGEFAEWRMSAVDVGSGNYEYKFHGTALNMGLRHNYSTGGLYFFDLLNPGNNNSEASFRLVPQSDCTPFPEVTVNVSGNSDVLKGDASLPVRGYVDPHTHITSYEFMGGKMMAGKPFHRWGVETALKDSSDIHGPWGSLDIIGNLYAYGDVNHRYDTRGWPDFPFWPNHKQMSHMQYYYKWIERAYLSGLRLMVTDVVENEVLCNVQKTVNPGSWINPNSCNSMDSIRLQVRRLNEMQDYIDAQAGGPGKGFFRLVTTPEETRQVIANGQLAVLIGVETSETFNCGYNDSCSRNDIEAGLDELYDLGIRAVFPAHKFDNQLSGARVEHGFINVGQWLSTGRFFETKECDENTRGAHFTTGFPIIGDVPFIRDILNVIGLNPEYDETIEHCNKYGLTELGVYLINRLIDRKMLIELDHLSAKAAGEVMDIVEARGYSGVISSHSWMNPAKDGGLHENTKRLIRIGGFAAPYNFNTHKIAPLIEEHLDVVEQTSYLPGVSFGTDMSGLGDQPAPRDDAETNPLNYPFTTEHGLTFHKQISGNRTFDLNQDGVAHYGLVADHVQDIREQASPRVYESIMNSAEAYLQMWERALQHTNTDYVNPLELFVKIVNRKDSRCMDINGRDDNLVNGANVQLWGCDDRSYDQQWFYNKQNQMFENRADRSKCLDNRGQAYNGGEIVIWDCVDSDNLRWTYDVNKLASKHDNNIVADAYNTVQGGNVGQWERHSGVWQEWELRPTRAIHTWVDFRSKSSGKCLDVTGGATANGTKVQVHTCNGTSAQQWFFDPIKGTLKSKLPGNKCLDVPAGQTNNGTELQIWDCQAGNMNQQFDKNGNVFRPRLNTNKTLDATGSDRVVLWEYHGRDNQRWRPGIN